MSEIIEVTGLDDFINVTTTGDVVVDFARRNGCAPCRALEPHLKIVADKSDKTIVKVMLDEADRDLLFYAVEQFNILGTPTVIWFKNGSVHSVIEGRTAPVILREIND